MALHPFDSTIGLRRSVAHDALDGHTGNAYANMVGPFGGVTAATALQGVMQHPARLGHPIALTVNFAKGLATGPLRVQATPARTNRSTQHWHIEIHQDDGAGGASLVMLASAVTAARRKTWSNDEEQMPTAPPPATLERSHLMPGIIWLDRYDLRAFEGTTPGTWDEALRASRIRMWMRDDPPRPLDYCALAALCDCFPPRVWLRRARRVPVGTVSMTTYFHAGPEQIAQVGTDHVLGEARGQSFRNGFFDQTGLVWGPDGRLLASTHQLTYYKE